MSSLSMIAPAPDRAGSHSGLRVWPLRRPALKVLGAGAAALFLIWSAAGLLFTEFLDDGPVGDADRAATEWFEDRRTPTINSLSYWGSMLSDTVVKVALIAVLGGAMVVAWRRWHDGVFLAVAVIMEATIFLFSSLVADRERPPVEQLDGIPPSGSFPSGHAAACVAFYGALCVVVFCHTRRRGTRAAFLALAIIAPLIVSVSRVARGMHHPVDVLAGLLLGVASIVVVRKALIAGARQIDHEVEIGELTAPDNVRRFDLTATGTERDLERAPRADASSAARSGGAR